MERLVLLDTETTGREAEDRIFQVAYEHAGHEYAELFKPPLPLCVEAMEATHYTNRDVEDKQPFASSAMHAELTELLNREDIVMVAHNAPFDVEMLQRDGITPKQVIDTLKIARHLDTEAHFNAYRLQYLRYALDLDVGDAAAHDALGDVRVLKALFIRLFQKMMQSLETADAVIDEMIAISSRPTLIRRISFGKHSGRLISELATEEPGYLEWLLRQKETDTENSHDQNEDWLFTLRQVLGKE